MESKACAAEGCPEPAAFKTRTRPAWCEAHITDILRLGKLEPLEPFTTPRAYRLTRCLQCGVEAHYRFEYTLDQNRYGTPTCRACYWRSWHAQALALSGINHETRAPHGIDLPHAVDGFEVLEYLDGPYLTKCLECGRLSAQRYGDWGSGCSCIGSGGRRAKTSKSANVSQLADKERLAGPEKLSSELAEQFVATTNGTRHGPGDLNMTSRRLVTWRDPNCGHTWVASPHDRNKVPRWRCPECRTILDSFAYHFPELAAEWSATNPKSAWQVRPSATLPFTPEWKCSDNPLRVWRGTLVGRTTGRGYCPMCRESGKSWVELEHFESARKWFGDAVSGAPVRSDAFTSRTSWYPDITVTLTNGRSLHIEYDGSYWHAAKVSTDEAKTRDLLATGALVVRLREAPLPLLEIDDPDLRQIVVLAAAPSPDEVMREVTRWIDRAVPG